jgi:hypothetical protein
MKDSRLYTAQHSCKLWYFCNIYFGRFWENETTEDKQDEISHDPRQCGISSTKGMQQQICEKVTDSMELGPDGLPCEPASGRCRVKDCRSISQACGRCVILGATRQFAWK